MTPDTARQLLRDLAHDMAGLGVDSATRRQGRRLQQALIVLGLDGPRAPEEPPGDDYGPDPRHAADALAYAASRARDHELYDFVHAHSFTLPPSKFMRRPKNG